MTLIVEQSAEEARRKRRSHIAWLRDQLRHIDARLDLLNADRLRFSAELEQCEAADDAVVDEPTPRNLKPDLPDLSEGKVRDVVVRLGAYTIRELTSVIGDSVTIKQVTAVHATLVERQIVRPTGQKFRGQPVYEYLAPVDPGGAFEAQRRQIEAEREARRPEQLAHHGGMVGGGIEGTGGQLIQRLPKAVRIKVRKAVRDGWDLVERGDGHFALDRPGYDTIGVSHTPRSATAEAVRIEARLRNARENQNNGKAGRR